MSWDIAICQIAAAICISATIYVHKALCKEIRLREIEVKQLQHSVKRARECCVKLLLDERKYFESEISDLRPKIQLLEEIKKEAKRK